MKRIILLTGIIIPLWGCAKEEISGGDGSVYDPEGKVEIMARPMTRGTPISDESQMTNMGIFCSYTGTEDWTDSDVPGKMFNRKLLYDNGGWDYEGSPEKWNAQSSGDRFTFFAYAPFAAPGNGIAVQSTPATPGIPALSYTVPPDVTLQPDLMVAVPRRNIPPRNTPVALEMQHALTCVGFQVAGEDNRITGIAIRGISTTGTLSVDGSAITWSELGPVDETTDFTASLNTDEGKDYYTATKTMSTNLMKGNGYLMMIPQLLGPEAKIVITEDGGNEIEIGLDAYEWGAGKQVNYNISIVPGGTVTVSPSDLLLPWFGVNQYEDNIDVRCYDTKGNPSEKLEWKLTVIDDWFTMTRNPDGSGQGPTVSGKGSAKIYTFATANTSPTARRETKIYMNDSPEDIRVNVVQAYVPDPETLTGGGDMLPNTYVGAYWRDEQNGERVIKIDVGKEAEFYGQWSASVAWWDPNWRQDDIVLAAGGSADPAIYSGNPGNPQNFPVVSPDTAMNSWSTRGTVDADGSILFRIGLKRTWPGTYDLPARYAVVIISHSNFSQHQKLFIRQGWRGDYVVHPDDVPQANKPYAKAFAPYNATAEGMNNNTRWIQVVPRFDPGSPKRAFTSYPSHAGALYQWAGIVKWERLAYSPTKEMVSGAWQSNKWNQATTWAEISEVHETCPDGYRRPTYSGSLAKSEMHVSLCTDLNKPLDCSLYGYYADGFFDRRKIEMSTTYVEGNPNSGGPAVNPTGADVAYIGRLVYNAHGATSHHQNASVFIPTAGRRHRFDGRLIGAGRYSHYWLGTSLTSYQPPIPTEDWPDPGHWWGLNIGSGPGSLEVTYSDRGHAFPVRCVRER